MRGCASCRPRWRAQAGHGSAPQGRRWCMMATTQVPGARACPASPASASSIRSTSASIATRCRAACTSSAAAGAAAGCGGNPARASHPHACRPVLRYGFAWVGHFFREEPPGDIPAPAVLVHGRLDDVRRHPARARALVVPCEWAFTRYAGAWTSQIRKARCSRPCFYRGTGFRGRGHPVQGGTDGTAGLRMDRRALRAVHAHHEPRPALPDPDRVRRGTQGEHDGAGAGCAQPGSDHQDNAAVRVDGVVFFQVLDAAKAAYEVANLEVAMIAWCRPTSVP